MGARKSIVFTAAAALLTVAALFATQNASREVPAREPSVQRPSLFDVAAIASAEPAKSTPPKTVGKEPLTNAVASPTSSFETAIQSSTDRTPASSAPSSNLLLDQSNPDDDLKSSQTRLNAIDQLTGDADVLFSTPGDDPLWSVNQQDMDQQDYRTGDGTITKWFGSGDEGPASTLRAEEAQLGNGEVIDRWYNDNGTVQQVMHQYDRNNSYSVYRYDTGEIEATRVIRDGNEIFTKYDRQGRQIQRTYTPAF